MKLIFSPARMDTPLRAKVQGDVLTLNGERLDFGPLPVAAILPRDAILSPWIAGDVTRDDVGVLTVPLILPHGANAPRTTLHPAPLNVTKDGALDLPIYDTEETRDVEN